MRVTTLAIIAMLLHGSVCEGSGPFGDVCPKVCVEDGTFVIYHKEDKPLGTRYEFHKTVISPAGKVLVERAPASYPGASERKEASCGYAEGIEVVVGDRKYDFCDGSAENSRKPFVTLIEGKKKSRIDLPWGKTQIQRMEDATVSGSELVLLAEKKTPDHRRGKGIHTLKNHLADFFLYRFQMGKDAAPTSKALDAGCEKCSFVTSSNFVSRPPKYYLCWQVGYVNERELKFTTWNAKENTVRTTTIGADVDGDVELSMARIDDNLLIAHDDGGNINYILLGIDGHRVLKRGKVKRDWSRVQTPRKYLAGIQHEIRKNLAIPAIITDEDRKKLEAVIVLRIFGNGKIKSIEMEKSSGNAIFDEAVIGAVKRAAPFAKPPEAMAYKLETQGIGMIFNADDL